LKIDFAIQTILNEASGTHDLPNFLIFFSHGKIGLLVIGIQRHL